MTGCGVRCAGKAQRPAVFCGEAFFFGRCCPSGPACDSRSQAPRACYHDSLRVLGGRGTLHSAVDAHKAPASPDGHGPCGPPFGRCRRWRGSPSPPKPPPIPSARLPGKRQGHEATLPPKASGASTVCLRCLLKLFVKFALAEPRAPGRFPVLHAASGPAVRRPRWSAGRDGKRSLPAPRGCGQPAQRADF